MMVKNIGMKKILLVFSLLISFSAFAQQDALFSQYTYNKLLVNPAYAGSRDGLNVVLIKRYQWVNLDGAPETMSISAHMPTFNRRVGLGAYYYRDVIGPTIENGFMGTYAYHIPMDKGTLSFGLQGGIKYMDFNWSVVDLKDVDYVYDPDDVKKVIPDLNIGAYYQTDNFFAGLSSKQLLENDLGYSNNGNKTTFSRLSRHFYLMAGGVVPLSEKIFFRPSFLTKYVKNSPVQFDFNAAFYFTRSFMVGASFRTVKAFAFMSEIALTDNIRLGYSYDIYLNELQLYNYGSHEIRLEFDLNLKNSRMLTPRFF